MLKIIVPDRYTPFEGATIGRELYREAILMQAVEKIQGKNYTSALTLIDDAKKWPLNLGVGRPYMEDLDERLEDWMDYLCYRQTGKMDEAQASLQKIVQFNPKVENTVSNFLSANHLVTAWTVEKLEGKAAAVKWLDTQVQQYPENKILKWCKEAFEKDQFANADTTDSEVRLLERIFLLHRQTGAG